MNGTAASQGPHQFEFGGFLLDCEARTLQRAGSLVALSPRAIDALVLLLENRGSVVTKQTFLDRLWPGVIVEENSVARLISDVRKVLGPAGAAIVTIAGQGYRFQGAVQRISLTRDSVRPSESVMALAVLPLAPADTNEEDRRLAFGLTDALITRLSALKGLTVRPTSSVLRFLNAPYSPSAAGHELKVSTVLCGTVRREAGRIRITVQLVDVEREVTLWGGRFDDAQDDLFALEDSLSEHVASALHIALSTEQHRSLLQRQTSSEEAYDLYLRGRFWCIRRTRHTLEQAVACFRRAIELDPQFVRAHAALADTYIFLCTFSTTDDAIAPHTAMPLARAAAERALAIDPAFGEIHSTLGFISFFYEWQWAKAETCFRRSIELQPNFDRSHHSYAIALSALGRHDEALEQINTAAQLDPTSLIIGANVGFVLNRARRNPEALEVLEPLCAQNPGFAYGRHRLGLVLQALGRQDDALREFDAAIELGLVQQALASKGHLLGQLGRHAEARAVLARLLAIARERFVTAYYFAEVYAGMGERDAALARLEQACDERPNLIVHLRTLRVWDPYRSDPRFEAILRRIGLQS